MKMGPPARSLAMMTVAATTATSAPHAAAQLVADVEFKEACELLRLGDALDVPEWLAFSRTPVLRFDPAGRLYLMGDDPHVAVLDSDGGFVRYIGGEGEGPGEFAHVGNFGFVGDTVWLQHLWELHIAYFDSAGVHIRTEVDRGLPSSAPSLWRTSTPLAEGRGFYIPASGNMSMQRVRVPMTVGSRSAPMRDTLGFRFESTGMRAVDGNFAYRPITIPPLYRVHPAGHGIVTADWEPDQPDGVVLRHYDPYGRVAWETVVASRLRRVSAEQREAIIDKGMEMVERARESMREALPRNLRAAVTEGLLLYDYFEPIRTFFLTHDDRVWLRDAAPSDGLGALWVVLGPDGTPEFRIHAPSGTSFKAALGDRVWGTARTELDVPYIALYQVTKPGTCG